MTYSDLHFLQDLEQIIADRKNVSDTQSYTASLFQSGVKRIAQKVGEEGVEVALAAVAGNSNELIDESADLLYHLIVLLSANDIALSEVVQRLKTRHQIR